MLSIIKIITSYVIKQKRLLPLLLFCFNCHNAQIVNYVNNGGFELCADCAVTSYTHLPKYWNAIDTAKYFGLLLSSTVSPYPVPASGFGYQWPVQGNNIFLTTFYYKPNTPQSGRGYPRNALKQTLQSGKTYCVKMYCSPTNQSTHGIDGIGAYFGDNTTDTITQCDKPITYLMPQIQNPTSNVITDTLNWTLLTGTFTANGTEKYMMLGNFKSDVATNSVLINPTNLPLIFTDFFFDNVSCIPIDLPAYAAPGSDVWATPGSTVYLGRPSDVGIDEACIWYKLPNTTNAIDTVAGITVTVAATTETYMVKQDICGVIKYDTVVVHASALGNEELKIENEKFEVFPNPAQDFIELKTNGNLKNETQQFFIFNALGQLIREEEVVFNESAARIKTSDLSNGLYFFTFKNNTQTISKRFAIAR